MGDITAQRGYETEMEMMAALVNSFDDAIISKDFKGRIMSWNRAAERMFDYTMEEAIGQDINLIIPKERRSEQARIIQAISQGKKINHLETIRVTKQGLEIPIALTVTPIKCADGKIITVYKITRNIARKKQLDENFRLCTVHLEKIVAKRTEELQEALLKERELGKLKSRFVSMACHEFRTPLSSIQLSSSLIGKYAETLQSWEISKHVNKIKDTVNNLTATLDDFLSMEKLESDNVNMVKKEFDLSDFCREIAAEMQLLTKPGQQILYKHYGSQQKTLLDRQILRNCLHNLLSNAIKYSDNNCLINFDTKTSASVCYICVQDYGIGIPKADQVHLFSAFFRASNTGDIQGTGLGLNIVSRYVALMHGTISIESEVGQGTKCTLAFPV